MSPAKQADDSVYVVSVLYSWKVGPRWPLGGHIGDGCRIALTCVTDRSVLAYSVWWSWVELWSEGQRNVAAVVMLCLQGPCATCYMSPCTTRGLGCRAA